MCMAGLSMIQQEQLLKLQRLERLLKNKDLVAFFAKNARRSPVQSCPTVGSNKIQHYVADAEFNS